MFGGVEGRRGVFHRGPFSPESQKFGETSFELSANGAERSGNPEALTVGFIGCVRNPTWLVGSFGVL